MDLQPGDRALLHNIVNIVAVRVVDAKAAVADDQRVLLVDLVADAAEQIRRKYPTSSIAVLRVPGSWADLEVSGAELISFHVPR